MRDELFAAIDAEIAKLTKFWEQELPALNALVAEKEIPAIEVKE